MCCVSENNSVQLVSFCSFYSPALMAEEAEIYSKLVNNPREYKKDLVYWTCQNQGKKLCILL
jgi:hypothetical protein